MAIYNYSVDLDPDADGETFFSVFADNGQGSSAEVAGKIGERKIADAIAQYLNQLQPLH